MTYAERLAEFVKVTGHKPGEMNKRIPCFPATQAEVDLYLPRFPGTSPKYGEMNRKDYEPTGSESSRITASPQRDEALHSVSLEPASQSAGPGSCNRFTRDKTGESYSVPCKLPVNHEGPHEP